MKKTQNPSSKIFQKLIDKMDETVFRGRHALEKLFEIDKMIKKVDGFMAKGGTLVTKFQKLIKRVRAREWRESETCSSRAS